jgi:HK97 family phage major capsid protein
MDDLRSLREQRDELRSQLDAIMERNDSIDDTESIEALEQGTARMAELDASIRSAEVKARYNEMREVSRGSYSFKTEKASASRSEGEYRFVMDGTDVRVEGRAAGDAASVGGVDPSSSLPGMSSATWGDMSAAIPVDLQAELIRKLPAKAVIRQFFQTRTYSNDIELQRVGTRVFSEATFNLGTANSVASVDESGSYPAVSMTLDRVRVNNFKTAAKSNVTEEFMKDARGRAVAELLLQHAEEHARLWDRAYAAGAGGTAGPEACFDGAESYITDNQTSLSIADATSTSGTTAAVAWTTALTDLRYDEIPAQYWGGLRWLMSQEAFAVLTRQVDANGRPLFQPLLTGTVASSLEVGTLLGLPVYVSNNLPNGSVTAGNTAAILAHVEDYCIFDRAGFSQQVDPYSAGDTGEIVYRTRMRSDGRWLRPFASGILRWIA